MHVIEKMGEWSREKKGSRQDGTKIPQIAEMWSFHCTPKQEHNNREIRHVHVKRTRKKGRRMRGESASFLQIRLHENRPSAATTSVLRALKHAVFLTCKISKPPGSPGDLFTRSRVYAERQSSMSSVIKYPKVKNPPYSQLPFLEFVFTSFCSTALYPRNEFQAFFS